MVRLGYNISKTFKIVVVLLFIILLTMAEVHAITDELKQHLNNFYITTIGRQG